MQSHRHRGYDRRGFSLVEVVTVTFIAGVLIAIATLNFTEYWRRYQIENQARTIYSEILRARAKALYERNGTRVRLYADRMEVYSTTADSETLYFTQPLGLPIVCNIGLDGTAIDFDNRGVTWQLCSICVQNPNGAGNVDSVVVNTTRVSLGKKDMGDDCSSANIAVR